MEGGDIGLKQQFQLLQEQQQQKLMERRKRKEEQNKKKGSANLTEKNASRQFGVADDLDLKLAEHSNKGYGYVSEELVDHLNSEIRQAKDENGRLYKLLSERDLEIRRMKKKKEEQSNGAIDNMSVTSETAATRIIELSKKVRELTSEKEAEKTRCKQFQKKCHDLQIQLQSNSDTSDKMSMMGSVVSLQSAAQSMDGKGDDDGIDVKALQDRLKQSESRQTDYRNQCQQLRLELKVANKVLSQEIGETVNIPALLNETSQWRGRAQQITALQKKVDELKMRYEGPISATDRQSGDKISTARRRQEEKNREDMKRVERERKEAQELTATKLRNLEEENGQLKNKLDASKTRSKVLSNEIKGMKSQVQTLLRKSQNDDEFIEGLMNQQKQLQEMLEQNNSKQSQQEMKQHQQLMQMTMKSQQDNNIVEQLKLIAAQKETQVKMLEMEIQHLGSSHAQQHNNQVNTRPASSQISQSVSPTADTPVNDIQPTFEIVEKNTNRSREVSQLSMSSVRTASRPSSQIGPPPGNSAPVNNITSQELAELRYHYQELTVLSKAVEVERDKMSELVQVLQTRLNEEVSKHFTTQQDLQGQKRAVIELEKQLGRKNMAAIQKHGSIDTKQLPSARDGGDESSDEELGPGTKSELFARLKIQKDENESLKTALQRSLKAKEEDLKVYSKTLEDTKQVFLQALRQMKDRQGLS